MGAQCAIIAARFQAALLEQLPGPARAEVVASESFGEFDVAVNIAFAAFHARLGREGFAAL